MLARNEENSSDEKFFLKHYSSLIKSKYFDNLTIKGCMLDGEKKRKWIYLNLQVLKQLKDLDFYLIPKGELVRNLHSEFNEEYYKNPEKEIEKT